MNQMLLKGLFLGGLGLISSIPVVRADSSDATVPLRMQSIYGMESFGAEIRVILVQSSDFSHQAKKSSVENMMLSAANGLAPPSVEKPKLRLESGPMPLVGDAEEFGVTDYASAKDWIRQTSERLALGHENTRGLLKVLSNLNFQRRFYYGYNPFGIKTVWGFYTSLLVLDHESGAVYDVRFPASR